MFFEVLCATGTFAKPVLLESTPVASDNVFLVGAPSGPVVCKDAFYFVVVSSPPGGSGGGSGLSFSLGNRGFGPTPARIRDKLIVFV